MGTDVVQFSEAPKSLAPFVLPADAGTPEAPAPVMNMTGQPPRRRVRDALARVPWLFPLPTIFSGSTLFVTSIYWWGTGYTSAGIVAISSAAAFIPSLTGSIVSAVGENAQWNEERWLKSAAKQSVTNWLLKELGADAFYVNEDRSNEYCTDIVRFVNDRAAGHLEFGIVSGGGWNLWREVDGGPITTDYQKRSQPMKAVVRALTEPQEREKPRRAVGQPESVAVAEMFDREGRRLLVRAETLLGACANIEDPEQAHRVSRAADIFKDVLTLTQQAAILDSAARRQTMHDITVALKDAVRELEAVHTWQQKQVQRNARILATYAGEVTNRPNPDGLHLPDTPVG